MTDPLPALQAGEFSPLWVLLAMAESLFIFGSAITLIPTGAWWIRGFDFPRLHLAVVGAVCLCLHALFASPWQAFDLIVVAALIGGTAIHLWRFLPFTRLWQCKVKQTDPRDALWSLSLMTANVLQDNREVDRLLAAVREASPDVVLLVEPDRWWIDHLQSLRESHPHAVEHPLPDGLGMALYARLPLGSPEIHHLVSQSRASITATLQASAGEPVLLWCLHPVPPGLKDERGERVSSRLRDAELMKVAKRLRGRSEPAIVLGDFNDVGWSHTTRLFLRRSRMLDPRIGRGLFNTYPAAHPLLRFPLDHIFVSRHFTLGALRVLGSIGSDHLPICAEVSLAKGAESGNERQEEMDPGDPEEAERLEAEGEREAQWREGIAPA